MRSACGGARRILGRSRKQQKVRLCETPPRAILTNNLIMFPSGRSCPVHSGASIITIIILYSQENRHHGDCVGTRFCRSVLRAMLWQSNVVQVTRCHSANQWLMSPRSKLCHTVIAGLLTTTRLVMSQPLPRIYDDNGNGKVVAQAQDDADGGNLIGGDFRMEDLQRISRETVRRCRADFVFLVQTLYAICW